MLQYENTKLCRDEMFDYTRKARACTFNHKQTQTITRARTRTSPDSPTVVVMWDHLS